MPETWLPSSRRVIQQIGAGTVRYEMTKADLHRLVDALPEESVDAAAELLRRARDPVLARLDAAPNDDEELTEEDLEAIRQARSEPAVSWSEAEAELDAG